jgi:hypothetical protein
MNDGGDADDPCAASEGDTACGVLGDGPFEAVGDSGADRVLDGTFSGWLADDVGRGLDGVCVRFGAEGARPDVERLAGDFFLDEPAINHLFRCFKGSLILR